MLPHLDLTGVVFMAGFCFTASKPLSETDSNDTSGVPSFDAFFQFNDDLLRIFGLTRIERKFHSRTDSSEPFCMLIFGCCEGIRK